MSQCSVFIKTHSVTCSQVSKLSRSDHSIDLTFATNNAEALEMATQPPFFMTLPPEIRLMIYKALLEGTDHFVTLKYLADENMVAANLLSRKRRAP